MTPATLLRVTPVVCAAGLALCALLQLADPIVVVLMLHPVPWGLKGMALVCSLIVLGVVAGAAAGVRPLARFAHLPAGTALLFLLGATVPFTLLFGEMVHAPRYHDSDDFGYSTEPRQTAMPNRARFAFFGDSGEGSQEFLRITELALIEHSTSPLDAVFLLGDNIYSREGETPADAYQRAITGPLRRFTEVGIPIFAILGNHDFDDPSFAAKQLKDPLLNMGGRLFNEVEFGPDKIAFFLVDSESASFDPFQTYWLKNKLNSSTAAWKVILSHKPYLSNAGGNPFVRSFLDASGIWDHDVQLIFSGDDHFYERLDLGGITQIVSGAASDGNQMPGNPIPESRSAYDEEESFVLADFTAKSVDITAMNSFGVVVDRVTIPREAPKAP